MLLTLTRPLVALDCETTGKDPKTARVLQLGFDKFGVDGSIKSWSHLFNPGCPIPPESTAKHGITDEMVRDQPPFKDYAYNIAKGFAECDFLAYNGETFDLPVLDREFAMASAPWSYEGAAIVDPLAIWRELEKRTLTDAYRVWCGKTLDGAHEAMADVRAAVEVLESMITLRGLPCTPAALHDFGFPKAEGGIDRRGRLKPNAEGHIVLHFGKYEGKTLNDVASKDRRYLLWLVNDSNMPADLKAAIKGFLHGTKT